MRLAGAVLITVAFTTVAFAIGTWEEYKPESFEHVSGIGEVAFNASGIGFAASSTLSGGNRNYTWKYSRGKWKKAPDPYERVVRLTIGPNGSCYGLAEGGHTIYRLPPGAQYWQGIGDPFAVGMRRFEAVVGVGRYEYWAAGVKGANGHGLVIHYVNDKPRQIFDLGCLDPNNKTAAFKIAAPRTANPSGEIYAVAIVRPGEEPTGRFQLSVLKPSGEITHYAVPISGGYGCGGLVARAPGEVRVSFHSAGNSIIFAFANGKFTEVARYADRCDVKAYPTPSEGWGLSYREKVYHWTPAGPSEEYMLSGYVYDLDFINAGSGWAVGKKQVEGEWVGMMWRYTSDVSITPTSLGRVKALFR
jgi:hypothetical protein